MYFRENIPRSEFWRGHNFVEGRDKLVDGATDLLRVVESHRLGKGLEAKVRIALGTRVFGIHGKVVEFSDEEGGRFISIGEGATPHDIARSVASRPMPDKLLPNAVCVSRDHNGQNVWVNPDPDSPLRYINHSCHPNTARLGPYAVGAIEEIKPGDSVTIDYATLEVDPDWKMRCECGSSDCRGEIRSVHFLTPGQIQRFWDGLPRFMKLLYLESAEGRYTSAEDVEILRKLKDDREGL